MRPETAMLLVVNGAVGVCKNNRRRRIVAYTGALLVALILSAMAYLVGNHQRKPVESVSGYALAQAINKKLIHDRGPAEIVPVTVYHEKYDGRTTKSGEVYDHEGRLTVAVPRDRWKELHGKYLDLRYGENEVTVYVNDTTAAHIKTNFDLSRFAWDALTDCAPPTRLTKSEKVQMWIHPENK